MEVVIQWRRGKGTRKFLESNTSAVMVFASSAAVSAFACDTRGAMEVVIQWRRGKGTRFIWNSDKSTFSSPSNRRLAVVLDTTFAMILFRFAYEGFAIPSLFWAML